MKALVCYKWVPDEADIIVDQHNKILKMDKVKYKVSEYDRNAIELGVSLCEKNGYEVLSLTAGKDVKASAKDVLARGIDKAYLIECDELESSISSTVLAEAIKKIGDIDVIICGEGSGDQYSQQVGPRLAALLGYQLITYAASVEVEGEQLKVERKLDDGTELVKVKQPVVLTVLPEINHPRIPGMKQILAAKKKPIEELTLSDLGFTNESLAASIKVMKVGPSIMERKQIRMNEGSVSIKDAVKALVQQLKTNKDI